MVAQTVYLFTGYPAAGKTELANMLSTEKEITLFEMGELAREVALEETDVTDETLDVETLSTVSNTLREKHGGDIYAERLCERMSTDEDVIISGVRSSDEIEYFEDNFEEVITIAVKSPFNIRFERFVERETEEDAEDYIQKDLENLDKDERKRGIENAIANADIVITNTQSVETSFVSLLEELN